MPQMESKVADATFLGQWTATLSGLCTINSETTRGFARVDV